MSPDPITTTSEELAQVRTQLLTKLGEFELLECEKAMNIAAYGKDHNEVTVVKERMSVVYLDICRLQIEESVLISYLR